jgi:hypothetical protein
MALNRIPATGDTTRNLIGNYVHSSTVAVDTAPLHKNEMIIIFIVVVRNYKS